MKVVGIIGGIASGKDTVAKIFESLGIKVFDADKIVHEIFKNDQQAIVQISKQFPHSYENGIINRKILGDLIIADPQNLKIIEQIIHSIVRNNYQQFINIAKENNQKLVVLNIPLLLENNFYKFDKLIAIIADEKTCLKRYLLRSGYDSSNLEDPQIVSLIKKFELLRSKQITDQQRIKLADYIVENNSDIANLKLKITEIFNIISS